MTFFNSSTISIYLAIAFIPYELNLFFPPFQRQIYTLYNCRIHEIDLELATVTEQQQKKFQFTFITIVIDTCPNLKHRSFEIKKKTQTKIIKRMYLCHVSFNKTILFSLRSLKWLEQCVSSRMVRFFLFSPPFIINEFC